LEYTNKVGMLGKVTTNIGEAGGDITAVDLVRSTRGRITRDITLTVQNSDHGQEVVKHLRKLSGVRVIAVSDPTFLVHIGGKISLQSRIPVKTRRDLAQVYTPGVGRVSSYIAKNKETVWSLTSKANTVAVVSDGTAVLGLGDIGPEAAMPVMEGKAILFKELAGVDAWPICLSTKDPDEIVKTVKYLSVGFGGINLEDISAPRCFYIEDRLKEELDIPVFHDDQHGTAVVVLAAVLNALRVVKKDIGSLKAVVAGAGASGVASAKMLSAAGVKNLIAFDRKGAIHKDRSDIEGHPGKRWLAESTNPKCFVGPIREALDGADLFIGLSGPGVIVPEDLARMNTDAIVFALANPDPEILPDDAHRYARIVATGRSDFPNQINNALCFPGLFRGVLDVRARTINEEMKLAAAQALAATVPQRDLSEEYIIPGIFNQRVATNVARTVATTALRTGVARRTRNHRGERLPATSRT
jgi:malate dehydrogenase (oxaloacetate-decarboxylating)